MKIDRYANFNKLTDKNPYLKVIFGVSMLVMTLLLNNIYTNLLIFSLMCILAVGVMGIPLGAYMKLLKIPMSFLILSVLTLLVSIGRSPQGFLNYINIGSFYLGYTREGIDMALNLFFRAMTALSCTYFIALSTPINQLVFVFKKLRFPNSFIEMCVLIYRFINIFFEEFNTMMNAIELKNGRNNMVNSIKSMGILGGAIFFRVMDSYEDWKKVLDVKFYDGNFYF